MRLRLIRFLGLEPFFVRCLHALNDALRRFQR